MVSDGTFDRRRVPWIHPNRSPANGNRNLSNAPGAVMSVAHRKVRVMPEAPPSPMFIADATGLDFLNSLAAAADTKVEWIGSGDDFLAWLGAAKLVPDDILAEMRRKASS